MTILQYVGEVKHVKNIPKDLQLDKKVKYLH